MLAVRYVALSVPLGNRLLLLLRRQRLPLTRRSPTCPCQSVAILVGNDQIWRIDPTGQFWKCHAVVAGRDSNKVEEALCAKLLECQDQQQQQKASGDASGDLGDFLSTYVSCEEALELVSSLLPDLLWPPSAIQRIPPNLLSASLPKVFWTAVAVEPQGRSSRGRDPTSHSKGSNPRTCIGKNYCGAFLPRIPSPGTTNTMDQEPSS